MRQEDQCFSSKAIVQRLLHHSVIEEEIANGLHRRVISRSNQKFGRAPVAAFAKEVEVRTSDNSCDHIEVKLGFLRNASLTICLPPVIPVC